tara:strand:+ start:451 stop:1167 length:717 start_codon:yes stop_codon:yes gene_type:complete
MGFYKEISKFFSKIIDHNIHTSFYPKLIYRNSSAMNKNDYKVPEDYKYIFIHVPKTAGISFISIIAKINKELKDNKIFPGNHNPMSILYSPLEKKYISVIRNPIERGYSLYKMQLKDKKQPYHYLAKKGLPHFFKYCPEAQNIFCKYYSSEIEQNINSDLFQNALENCKNFYQIINFENFEKDIYKFLNKLNIKNIEIPHLNQSDNKKKITDDELKIIKFYNYYDLKLYDVLKSNLVI